MGFNYIYRNKAWDFKFATCIFQKEINFPLLREWGRQDYSWLTLWRLRQWDPDSIPVESNQEIIYLRNIEREKARQRMQGEEEVIRREGGWRNKSKKLLHAWDPQYQMLRIALFEVYFNQNVCLGGSTVFVVVLFSSHVILCSFYSLTVSYYHVYLPLSPSNIPHCAFL